MKDKNLQMSIMALQQLKDSKIFKLIIKIFLIFKANIIIKMIEINTQKANNSIYGIKDMMIIKIMIKISLDFKVNILFQI